METHLTLPPVADLIQGESLKRQLLAALAAGGPVTMNAGGVQRIGSPALQLLAAARQAALLKGSTLEFTAASPAFAEAVRALDLGAALGLPEADHA